MTTIICPHCGQDVNETAVTCANCGASLELPVAETAEASTPAAPVDRPAEETTLPPTPTKKGAPVWWRVIRCLFSIPLTVLLSVALVAFTVVLAARNITTTNTVESILKEVQPTKIIAEAMSEGKTDSFAEVIYDTYEETFAESGVEELLSQEELQTVLDASTLDEFLTDKTAQYLSAFLNGEGTAAVTKEELLGLVQENEEVIREVTGGYELTEDDYQILESAIDESGVVEQMDLSQLLPETDTTVVETVQTVKNGAFYALIALCLVLVLLIALFNLRGHFLTSLYSGIALLVAGAITSLTLAAEALAVDIIASSGLPFSLDMLSTLVHNVLSGFWKTGFCMLGGGVFCILLFAIARIIKRHRTVK